MKCSEIYLQNVRVVNLVTKSTEGMMRTFNARPSLVKGTLVSKFKEITKKSDASSGDITFCYFGRFSTFRKCQPFVSLPQQ